MCPGQPHLKQIRAREQCAHIVRVAVGGGGVKCVVATECTGDEFGRIGTFGSDVSYLLTPEAFGGNIPFPIAIGATTTTKGLSTVVVSR
jgi:hypothetical protein